MADVVDRATRSRMMSGIRGRDTKPELTVRKYLHAHGLRYRIAQKSLPGKPDIVLAKYRTAVFVHGCFWHRHDGCRYATTPATNPDFWQRKFDVSVARDKRVCQQLANLGWNTIVVWECELTTGSLQELVADIRFRTQHPKGPDPTT